MPVVKQRQLEDGWVKVVEGEVKVNSLDRPCRLWIRRGGEGEAILSDLPLVINQGDTYKVEILNSS